MVRLYYNTRRATLGLRTYRVGKALIFNWCYMYFFNDMRMRCFYIYTIYLMEFFHNMTASVANYLLVYVCNMNSMSLRRFNLPQKTQEDFNWSFLSKRLNLFRITVAFHSCIVIIECYQDV